MLRCISWQWQSIFEHIGRLKQKTVRSVRVHHLRCGHVFVKREETAIVGRRVGDYFLVFRERAIGPSKHCVYQGYKSVKLQNSKQHSLV